MKTGSRPDLVEWSWPCAAFSPTTENLVNRSSGPWRPWCEKKFSIFSDAKNFVVYSEIRVHRHRFFTLLTERCTTFMSSSAGSESAILPSESPAVASIAPQEMVGDGKAWGLCSAVDLQDCNPGLIRNADHIRRYVVELCELIDMKRFGECQVVDFGSGRVAGYSMVQLISTSLISGHFANDTNNAYLDIFSCKGYDPAVVEAFSKDFFGARRSMATVTLRY